MGACRASVPTTQCSHECRWVASESGGSCAKKRGTHHCCARYAPPPAFAHALQCLELEIRACKSSSQDFLKASLLTLTPFCTGITNTFFCSSNKSLRPSRRSAQSGAFVLLRGYPWRVLYKGSCFPTVEELWKNSGKNFTHRTAPQLQAAVSCIFLTQLDVLATHRRSSCECSS